MFRYELGLPDGVIIEKGKVSVFNPDCWIGGWLHVVQDMQGLDVTFLSRRGVRLELLKGAEFISLVGHDHEDLIRFFARRGSAQFRFTNHDNLLVVNGVYQPHRSEYWMQRNPWLLLSLQENPKRSDKLDK